MNTRELMAELARERAEERQRRAAADAAKAKKLAEAGLTLSAIRKSLKRSEDFIRRACPGHDFKRVSTLAAGPPL